jgi:hypothetical protein
MLRRLLLAVPLCLAGAPASAFLLGPRPGSGAGFACGPDPAPAPAAAHGFTCETYLDTFPSISEIDTGNTRAPGFRWYLNNAWPGLAQGAATWQTMPATDPSTFTVGGAGLQFSVGAAFNNSVYVNGPSAAGSMLTSCATTGVAGQYVGNAFTNGYYIDITWGTYVRTAGADEALSWYEPIEFFAGAPSPAPTPNDIEIDNSGTFSAANVIYWSGGATAIQITNHLLGGFSGGNRSYGTLVVTPAQNAGSGIVGAYMNDVLVNNFTYGTTGNFSELAGEHMCILLQANYQVNMNITSVKVWQLPQ